MAVPRKLVQANKRMTLTADVFFVDGTAFLLTVSRRIKFVIAEHLSTRTAVSLSKHMTRVLDVYRLAGVFPFSHCDHCPDLYPGAQQSAGHIQFQKLAYYRVPLRLGEEVFDKGKISSQKALQFQQTIQAFQLLAQTHEVSHLRAVATSAMREASNGKKIAKQILQHTGVQIDIISGDEEAQLIFKTFDSGPDELSWISTPHSAFWTEIDPNQPLRQSIELRCAVELN